MFLTVLSVVFLVLIVAATVFLAKAGMSFCEDSRMVKILLSGYFGLYVVTAIVFKLALPTVPATNVDAGSLIGVWARAVPDLSFSEVLPWNVVGRLISGGGGQ